jgi:hypothetical protein
LDTSVVEEIQAVTQAQRNRRELRASNEAMLREMVASILAMNSIQPTAASILQHGIETAAFHESIAEQQRALLDFISSGSTLSEFVEKLNSDLALSKLDLTKLGQAAMVKYPLIELVRRLARDDPSDDEE